MYQGHKSRAAWNVALHLFNDYGLYTMMRERVRCAPNKDAAAEDILERVPERTPDGYRYTKTTIRLALQHWES